MTDMPNPSKDDIRRAIEVIQKFWVPLIADGSEDAFSVSLLGDNVVELLKCLIGDSDAIGGNGDLMEDGFRRLECGLSGFYGLLDSWRLVYHLAGRLISDSQLDYELDPYNVQEIC